VPVYNAGAKAAAVAPAAKPKKAEVAEVDHAPAAAKSKAAKKKKDSGDEADASKTNKKAAQTAQAAPVLATGPHPLGKPETPKAVASVEPSAKTAGKKAEPDKTPIGAVNPTAAAPALNAQQADASGASPEFRWPARGRIIQGFKSGGNDGINISVPEGTSVRAAEDGKVAYAGSALKGYGNLVLIRHPNGFVTAYANNSELSVKSGDTVKRGQVIAKSGQSGDVSAPQLHFELRKGSTPVDPTTYLAGI
jgi:murein DD-endopeptidase MepM/ murein hydrolase activator NlpD